MITEEQFVSLTDSEIKSIHHFMYNHCVIKHCARSVVIKRTPGSIGSGLTIKCKDCGVKKDITDYDSW